MKRRIPPELDRLMWTLAEERNERALEEFEVRYPGYRTELAKRFQIVSGLRRAPRRSERATEIPRFSPRQPVALPMRRGLYVAALAGFAVLAMASFYVTTQYLPENAVAPQGNDEASSLTPPKESAHRVEPTPNDATPPEVPVPKDPTYPDPPINDVPEFLKPVDVKLKHTGLKDAIMLIAAKGGLKVDMAPDMPNPKVDLEYQQMSVIEILKDLGTQYAFTAFDEGDGTILVIPAVDEESSPRLPTSDRPVISRDESADARQRQPREFANPSNG